jgi:hypothetical protein
MKTWNMLARATKSLTPIQTSGSLPASRVPAKHQSKAWVQTSEMQLRRVCHLQRRGSVLETSRSRLRFGTCCVLLLGRLLHQASLLQRLLGSPLVRRARRRPEGCKLGRAVSGADVSGRAAHQKWSVVEGCADTRMRIVSYQTPTVIQNETLSLSSQTAGNTHMVFSL